MRNFNRNGGSKPGRRDSGRFGRRSSDRFSRRDSGRPSFEKRTIQMHQAICDKCGQSCEVPFKPSEGKPVYCRACFEKKETPMQESQSNYGSSRREFRPRRESSEPRQESQSSYRSPRREFRPRHESSEPRQESGKLAAELQQINAKLDKILEILGND